LILRPLLILRPFLENPDSFDFRPKEGSPLVDAGVTIPGYTDGFQGEAPDLGAYELGVDPWIPGADWVPEFSSVPSGLGQVK
jgi:hypothetical protein